MKVAFLTNYYNHHQKYLADELYKLLGEGNYFFITTMEVPEFRKKMGYQELNAPYLLKYSDETKNVINNIVLTFDVILYSSAPLDLIKPRFKVGKLTFSYSERRYKTITRYLKYPINTYISTYLNRGYVLCASAFTAKDYLLSGMPLKKCFRWGYFPEVKIYDDINAIIESKDGNKGDYVTLLWAGRLIKWKHPEFAIYVANKLKTNGKKFKLKLIGTGDLEDKLKRITAKYHLDGCVQFLGSMSPMDVRKQMESADIFLFTSNREEGWGAVLNESLNSACAVIASDAIGSVPYLIDGERNGMIFRSGNCNDLFKKVKSLIENPDKRKHIQKSAYITMKDLWSPQIAARNFLSLAESLLQNRETPIDNGPGSQAPLLLDKWII